MKIKYEISRLNNAGSNYSVFLSHTNAAKNWLSLADTLSANGINPVSDKEISPGAPDFSTSIKNMIKDNEIFVMLIENGKMSQWMEYELGLAVGLSKKIILFSYESVDENANYFFRQHGPVITDIDNLIHEIKNSFFFSDLFQYETMGLTKSMFLNTCMSDIDVARLSFAAPGIDDIPKSVYKFGYLLLSIARYEGLGIKRDAELCNMTADELEDGICEIDDTPCSLCAKQCFESPTDVILNKILFNSSVDMVKQKLIFTIPYNKHRGVTFKCFVDVSDMDYVQDMVSVLQHAGIEDISVSDSVEGNRIYFVLPQSVTNGLFYAETPEGFINNYMCKGAVI